VETTVRFGALDNAPFDITLDPETHHAFQKTYAHALGKDGVQDLISRYYSRFFESLSQATGTHYVVETYSDQQASPAFRAEFLRTLERLDDIRWWLAPSHGTVHTRIPCPACGWAEKRAERTRLVHLGEDGARFAAVCWDHGPYEAHIDPEDDSAYLDLATLYRNLVKERAMSRDTGQVMHVMMKGGDWTFGCQLVDGALGTLGTPAKDIPMRIFTPMVLAPTGAKLSKSLLREQGKGALPTDVEPWMLDTTTWPRGDVDNYVDTLLWLVGHLLTDPKHFFRSFTVKELGRLMTSVPTDLPVRAHEMGIYKRYFDLIKTGLKTTEIRVNDASRQKIKVGDLIRFQCQGETALTRVTRVARYLSFDEMFNHEAVAAVNPLASREEQLANIRQIYPPEREALGVVALGISLTEPAPAHS
jgi:ASC-1-like (ASCH) protein